MNDIAVWLPVLIFLVGFVTLIVYCALDLWVHRDRDDWYDR